VRLIHLLPALLIGAATFAGCPGSRDVINGVCMADEDCGAFQRCDAARGVCLCTGDNACDPAEFCNVAGNCQPLLNCLNNEDCRTEETPFAICNTDNGQCITLDGVNTQCAKDAHCPFGFFCDASRCVQGCRDNGDCPLGEPCIEGACDFNPGACNENGYCDYGEMCTENLTCFTHPDANELCTTCDPFGAAGASCESCLIDPSVPGTLCAEDNDCSDGSCVHFPCFGDGDCPPGESCDFFECSGHCGAFFCGNESCDDVSNPCPRGYSCFQVVRVSNNLCTKNGGECSAGATCSADAEGENQNNGSCSCLSDGDCPIGLTCVNPGPGGACIDGSTCAPASGLTCEDLR
jgi:hypothetical protein